jgi:hypothetical protein
MIIRVVPAIALSGGTWIWMGVLIVGFFAVVIGWYTRKGSGINQHPYADLDHDSGPERPSELAHDTTQEIDNWTRGVGAHRRRRRVPVPEQLDDEQLREELRAWRLGTKAGALTALDAATEVRGSDSGAEVIVFWDYLAPDAAAFASSLQQVSATRSIREAALQLPIADARPLSYVAALAVEAARAQGAFWVVHDCFLSLPPEDERDCLAAAELVGDPDRFRTDVAGAIGRDRILREIGLARASGVHGVPAVFIGGMPYEGTPDGDALGAALDSPSARPWERRIPLRSA